MATLTGSTIASSYEQLLSLPDGGGNGASLVAITDGDAGTTFCISITDASTGKAVLAVDGSHANGTEIQIDNSAGDGDAFLSFQLSGTSKFTMGVDDGDSDVFKIGTTAIGTGTMFVLDTSSKISLSNNDGGTSNTILGKLAGDDLASGGNYNVFVGEDAGHTNKLGDNNIAIGYDAMDLSYIDDTQDALTVSNIFIGKDAGGGDWATAASHSNVGIGNGTLDAAMNGATYNTAVGFESSTNLTEGDQNTCMGVWSGYNLTTGDNNTAIGNSTLGATGSDAVTGSNNVAIGGSAMTDIDSGSSNVSIGHLSGDALTSTDNVVLIGTSAGSTINDDAAAGTVAIGTSALTSLTDGAGNTAVGHESLTDSTAENNTVLGFEAGKANTTGDGNTYIGYRTGKGASGVETGNTAVGTNALLDIVSGEYNVAVGFQSAQNLTDGDENIVMGTNSLNLATSTVNCIALGRNAMQGITTNGIDSAIAIGYGALTGAAGTTTGANNTIAIGRDALAALTSGARNLAIGHGAADALTQGDDNIAIGIDAMGSMAATDGNDKNLAIGQYALANAGGSSNVASANIAVGYSAGVQVTTGDHNVCMGVNAGVAINVGRKNICIGTGAGETITASDECVSIGYDSDCASDADASIAIGAFALATAAECVAIGNNINNGTTRTVKFGDGGASMVSLDWDTSGDSTWTRSSDRRRKRNIKDNTLGLEFINKLQTRTFQLKPQNELPEEWVNYSETNRYDTEKVHVGFIAQELKALIDEYDAPDEVASWSEDPDGMQRAGETKLITPLIKAVQELSQQVEELKAKIN